MKNQSIVTLLAILAVSFTSTILAAPPKVDFTIERSVALLTKGDGTICVQSRAAALPGSDKANPSMILVTQKIAAGSHNFKDMYQLRSDDLGKTWSEPKPLTSLRRVAFNDNGDEHVIGDFSPKLHEATGTILGTGKTFTFSKGKHEDINREQVSYSVYDPKFGSWSGLKILKLPRFDRTGAPLLQANAGCTQRVDLPDGDVLLPVRYRRGGVKGYQYISIVVRCGFDGKELVYKTYGSELTINRDRGLYEPSLAEFGGRYFMTMRADHSAFVARSDDGLHFEPIREWMYDDGQILGSYNTQQHWVSHPKGLFLVYTRRGANNDHIIRNRAPLFIAQVDPERLCIIRDTEQVLIPEDNAMMGNFGVVRVNDKETWVVVGEVPLRPGTKSINFNGPNRTFIAKILWNE